MASLPPIKTLQTQDFSSQSAWIGPLIYILNLVFGSVYSALSNGLTLQANSLAQIDNFSIGTIQSTYYAGPPAAYATNQTSQAITIPWKYKSKPVGCLLVNLVDTSSTPVPVTVAVSIDWSFNGTAVVINSISGLNAAKSYSCTFYTIGG